MKKILKYISFAILAITICTISPKALVSKLTPSATKVAPNTEFNVSIVLTGVNNGLASADYTIEYDSSKVTYVSYKMGQGKSANDIMINSSINNQILISYVDSANGSNALSNGTAIILTFKSKSSSTSGTTEFKLSGSGYGDSIGGSLSGTTNNTTITFYKPSNEALLKSLSISGYELNPTFNSSTKSYTLLDTESESITISATASAGATISGKGKKNLKYGENTINIIVTAEDKVTKNTYTIKVNRIDNRSANNRLKNLIIDGIDLDFDSEIYFYKVEIPDGVTLLDISAETEDKNATIQGVGSIDIGTDTKSHVINVTAENGDTTSYTIIFTNRSESESSSPSTELSKLIINDIEIDLKQDSPYLFGVNNDIDRLDIKYETSSITAKVDIKNATNLIPGITRVVIIVSDEGLSPKEYVVLVHKDQDFTKVESFAQVNDSNVGDELIIQLPEEADKTINENVINTLQSGNGKVYIHVVNNYQGLLYSLSFDKKIDLKKDLDLSIAINNNNPLTFTTNLPKGVTITYYVGNVASKKLQLYGLTSKGTQELIEENIIIENGYVTFVTDGSTSYILDSGIANIDDKEQSSINPFLYILLGVVIGAGGMMLIQFFIQDDNKLREKLMRRLSINPKQLAINSVLARKDEIMAEVQPRTSQLKPDVAFAVDPNPATQDHYFDMDAPFMTAPEQIVGDNFGRAEPVIQISQVFQQPGHQVVPKKPVNKVKMAVQNVMSYLHFPGTHKTATSKTQQTVTNTYQQQDGKMYQVVQQVIPTTQQVNPQPNTSPIKRETILTTQQAAQVQVAHDKLESKPVNKSTAIEVLETVTAPKQAVVVKEPKPLKEKAETTIKPVTQVVVAETRTTPNSQITIKEKESRNGEPNPRFAKHIEADSFVVKQQEIISLSDDKQ